MIIDILLLIVGLLLILAGANYLTDGASAVARKMHVSDLVIGLTIVAFGTSAPELVISIVSALQGSSEIALGNVVGSNIFNIQMIVGCTALVMPISVGRSTMEKEIPLVVLSSCVLYFCAQDMLIDGAGDNVISRADGLILLAFFLIFMAYTFSLARNGGAEAVPEATAPVKQMKTWLAIVCILGGLAGLIFGGRWFVDGASGLAKSLGVSESVIGLTIVAAGTSLPELATSIVAALKKNPDIAIGNVVGSCLFNVFFILGTSAAISPLKVGSIAPLDFYMLIGASILLFIFSLTIGRRRITRPEGAVMAAIYVAYTVYLVAGA